MTTPKPVKMTKKQYTLLEELFMQRFPDKRSNPRMKKSETLFQLAHQAKGGCIVELGAYQGNGAICLTWGTEKGHGCPVYTVDDYVERDGFVGEHYGMADYELFLSNVDKALPERYYTRPILCQEAAEELVKSWDKPIALLYWDFWGKERLAQDFAQWSPWVCPGGVYAVHEPGDHQFGGNEIIEQAQASGLWKPVVQWGGFVWTMEKK